MIRRNIITILSTIIVIFLIFGSCISQSLVVREIAYAQETYRFEDSINVQGIKYDIYGIYSGSSFQLYAVLDSYGNIKSDQTILQSIFYTKELHDKFSDVGFFDHYETIYDVLKSIQTTSKSAKDTMTWVTVATWFLNLVGAVYPPALAVSVPAATIATYITNGLNTLVTTLESTSGSFGTVSQIRTHISTITSGQASATNYEEILRLNSDLKTQIEDVKNDMILNIVGYGNLAIGEGLKSIGSAIKPHKDDWGTKLESYGANMTKAFKDLDDEINWLKKIDETQIKNDATTFSQNQINSFNSRITQRNQEINNKKDSVSSSILNVRTIINSTSSQGADVSKSYQILSSAETSVNNAVELKGEFKFNSAIAKLDDAEDTAEKAKTDAETSLEIHNADDILTSALNEINNSVTRNANVSSARSAYDETTEICKDAKTKYYSEDYLNAKLKASECKSKAENALKLAREAPIITTTTTTIEVIPPTNPLSGFIVFVTSPMGVIIIFIILVILGLIVLYKKGYTIRKIEKPQEVENQKF